MTVRNKAAESLEALYSSTREPVNAAESLAKLDQTRVSNDQAFAVQRTGEAEEASFATPEALATAVGAGFILGPAGGLIMGLAQGILGKQMKQNALDQFAEQNEAISDANQIFDDELARLTNNAMNPQDLDTLSALQTQKDVAVALMQKANPALQEQGAQMFAKFQEEMFAYTTRQEADAEAAAAFDKQLARDLEQEQYSRYTSSHDSFRAESQVYEDVTGAVNIAMQALEEGTPASLYAASIQLAKALDPTSVVRPEEAAEYQKLGGLWQQVVATYGKLKDGESLTPEQRRDMVGVLANIQGTNTKVQLAREARYIDELKDTGVPFKYWNNFQMVNSVPAAQRPNILGQTVRNPVETAAEAGQGWLADERMKFTNDLEAGATALNNMWNWLKGGTEEDRQKQRNKVRELPTN